MSRPAEAGAGFPRRGPSAPASARPIRRRRCVSRCGGSAGGRCRGPVRRGSGRAVRGRRRSPTRGGSIGGRGGSPVRRRRRCPVRRGSGSPVRRWRRSAPGCWCGSPVRGRRRSPTRRGSIGGRGGGAVRRGSRCPVRRRGGGAVRRWRRSAPGGWCGRAVRGRRRSPTCGGSIGGRRRGAVRRRRRCPVRRRRGRHLSRLGRAGLGLDRRGRRLPVVLHPDPRSLDPGIVRPARRPLADHDDLPHRTPLVAGPEVHVRVVDDLPVGKPTELAPARLAPVPVGHAVGRTQVGHVDGGIDPEVVGNVDPAPPLLPQRDDHLGRHPRLPGQHVDHGEFVGEDPGGVPPADRLHRVSVVVADGQVEVAKPIPIEHDPGLHLRRSGSGSHHRCGDEPGREQDPHGTLHLPSLLSERQPPGPTTLERPAARAFARVLSARAVPAAYPLPPATASH
jgi:hypothetical protein